MLKAYCIWLAEKSKEGTTIAGLPGWEDAGREDECQGRRLDPKPKRDDVCESKAWLARSKEDSEIATESSMSSSAETGTMLK